MDEARKLTYSIDVKADTSQAESNLRQVTSNIGNVQTQAGSIGEAFRNSFRQGIESGESFTSSIRSGVCGAFTYAGESATSFKDKFVSNVQSLDESLDDPINTIKNGLVGALQDADDGFSDMEKGAEDAGKAAGETADDVDDLADAAEKSGDAAEKSGSKFEGFGTIVKGVGVAITAATAAVGAFAASAVSTGQEFDSAMSQVAATMGYSVEELNDSSSEAAKTFSELRNFAMDMGASTAFSANEAAQALNYMALAGYDSEESMQMLPTVLNLAAAGGMELATASDMVTDAQSALDLSMDESAEMVDKMAMAASKSNTSVEQLGQAFLSIGGTAKNLSGGTTELSSALGILADNGIKGAEGGTHLRNIILALGSPTDTAATALEKLGVSAYDADGNFRPLEETFGDMQDALSSMSQADQLAVLGDIFNNTDLASANALLGTNAERWEELNGAIGDAAGSAQDMANVQLDNLAGDITLFQSALEGAKIVVSDQLTPTLREFTQFGTNAVSELSTAFQEEGLSGAMAALGSILSDGLGMIIDMLPTAIDAGMQLLGALGQGILDNLPTLINAAATIIVTLATGIGNSLPELIPSVVETLLVVVETIIENLPLILDAGMQILSGLAEGILNAVPILAEQLPVLIDSLIGFFAENLPTFLEQGSEIILTLATGLLDALPDLVSQLPTIITGITSFVAENLPLIVETGVNILLQLAAGIIQTIPQLVAQLPEIISAIVSGIGALMSSITEIGQNIVKGIWEGISSMTDWIGEKVSGFFSGIVGGVKGLLGIHSPSRVFAEIGDNMALGLGGGFESTMDSVTKDIEDSIPTKFDMPAVNIPSPSDLVYEVNPAVNDFNMPDISTADAVVSDTNIVETNNAGSTTNSTSTAFAPVINITIEGGADEPVVDNLRNTLYDTVRQLFTEFREEELERMTLKNQFAF